MSNKITDKCGICTREIEGETYSAFPYGSISTSYGTPVNHSFSGRICPMCAVKFDELMSWIKGQHPEAD